MVSEESGGGTRRDVLKAVGAAGWVSVFGVAGVKAFRVDSHAPDPALYAKIDVEGGDEREWGITHLEDPAGVVEDIRVRREIPAEWLKNHEGQIAEALPMPDPESFAVDFTLNTDAVPQSIDILKPDRENESVSVHMEQEAQVTWYLPAGKDPWTGQVSHREVSLSSLSEAVQKLSDDPLWKEMARIEFDVGEVPDGA